MLVCGSAADVGDRWLSIRATGDLEAVPLMLFSRDGAPPPHETTSPKTMAKTAVHVTDSNKRSFALDNITPPIPPALAETVEKNSGASIGRSGLGPMIGSVALPK